MSLAQAGTSFQPQGKIPPEHDLRLIRQFRTFARRNPRFPIRKNKLLADFVEPDALNLLSHIQTDTQGSAVIVPSPVEEEPPINWTTQDIPALQSSHRSVEKLIKEAKKNGLIASLQRSISQPSHPTPEPSSPPLLFASPPAAMSAEPRNPSNLGVRDSSALAASVADSFVPGDESFTPGTSQVPGNFRIPPSEDQRADSPPIQGESAPPETDLTRMIRGIAASLQTQRDEQRQDRQQFRQLQQDLREMFPQLSTTPDLPRNTSPFQEREATRPHHPGLPPQLAPQTALPAGIRYPYDITPARVDDGINRGYHELALTTTVPAWKLINIGHFSPMDTSTAEPVGYDKSTVIFHDVELWIQSIESYAIDPARAEHIRANVWQLLRGEAMVWWQSALSQEEQRAALISLKTWYHALRDQFGVRPAEAQTWLDQASFTIEAARNGDSIRQFAAQCFRMGRAWGDTTDLQLLTRFFQKLDPIIRQFCAPPAITDLRGQYISRVDEKIKSIRETAPSRLSNLSRRQAYTAQETNADINGPEDDDTANWGERRNYRGNNRSFPQHRPSHGYTHSPRPERSEWWMKNDRTQARFTRQDDRGENRRAYRSRRANQHFRGRRYHRLERRNDIRRRDQADVVTVWLDDDEAQQREIELQAQGYTLVSEGEESGEDSDITHTESASFAEARSIPITTRPYRVAQPSARAQPIEESFSAQLVTTREQVIEAIIRPDLPTKLQDQSHSHLIISIQFDTPGASHFVCVDTGTSTVLVDRKWITKYARKPVWRKQPPKRVQGVASIVEVNEQVTFDFYVPGHTYTGAAIAHFTITADVMDNLGPKTLLGTAFLYAHGAKVDFVQETVTFRSARSLVSQGQLFHAKLPPANRPVRLATQIDVKPGESMLATANWDALPSSKITLQEAYHLRATAKGVCDATVAIDTPKVVYISNAGHEPLTYQKQQVVGYIEEYNSFETANFISFPSSLLQDPSKEYGSMEEAFLQETLAPIAPDTAPASSPTNTPESIDGGIPNYGPTRPDRIPSILNKFGVHIAAEDPIAAAKFVALTDKYDIYSDRGLIPMEEEQKMRINLVEGWQNQKKTVRPYPLGVEDRKLLDEVHDRLIAEGKMAPMDLPSPIACPAFIVWRVSNGVRKGRVVIDLRPLNKITVPDAYPLPDQSDIMNDTRGSKWFSVLDGTGFFHQLPVYTAHRDRMVVCSARGLEISNVALMGFRNSPAFGQRFVDRLFSKLRHFIRVYIDDFVVFSDTMSEHLDHLEQVLKITLDNRVRIAAEKSFIAYPAVKLLGYMVDGNGIQKTDERLAAFRKMTFPLNLSALETFIGMGGFLRKGVPWFDIRIQPLQLRKTNLLKEARERQEMPTGLAKAARKSRAQKKVFKPTKEETDAFEDLRRFLSSQLFLWHSDPTKPLFLKIDVCKNGFGLFAFQLRCIWDGIGIPGKDIAKEEIRPILFLSRLTSATEKRYGSTEAEIAAVAWAIRKLRKMVQSSREPVNIITDHAATKGILTHTSLQTMDLNKANLKLAGIANYLSQFNLRIFHLPGILNVVPDALSRLPVEELLYREAEQSTFDELEHTSFAVLGEEVTLNNEYINELVDGYRKDPKLHRVIQILRTQMQKTPRTGSKHLTKRHIVPWKLTEKGLLYHVDTTGRQRLCIPTPLVKSALTTVHDDRYHFGLRRMMGELSAVYFNGMRKTVRKFIDFCPVCRENSTSRRPKYGELQPIPVIPHPYHTISLDFITDLPEVPSEGTPWARLGFTLLDTLCPVNCLFSKKTMLLAGHTTYTAADWAETLLQGLQLCDWGIPKRILSDRDPKFTSALWQALFTLLKVKFLMSTAYHPQTDGISERKNQTVETAIRYHTATEPDIAWVNVLPALQHALNNAYTAAINCSPNELVMGFKPVTAVDLLHHDDLNIEGNAEPDLDIIRRLYQHEAKVLIDIAAMFNKGRYDARHTPVDIDKGDTVYLRLHHGYQLPGNPKKKWSPTRAGPYMVKEIVGTQAFKLDFPSHWRVHPVVSAAHLWKPTQGMDPFHRIEPAPQPIALDGNGEADHWELDRIIRHRVIWRKRKPYLHFLVRWKGFTAKDDSWLTDANLNENAFDLKQEYIDSGKLNWTSEYTKKGISLPKRLQSTEAV